jgi:hypothetical protein
MARSARVTGSFLEVRSLQGVFSSGHEKVSRLEASPDWALVPLRKLGIVLLLCTCVGLNDNEVIEISRYYGDELSASIMATYGESTEVWN